EVVDRAQLRLVPLSVELDHAPAAGSRAGEAKRLPALALAEELARPLAARLHARRRRAAGGSKAALPGRGGALGVEAEKKIAAAVGVGGVETGQHLLTLGRRIARLDEIAHLAVILLHRIKGPLRGLGERVEGRAGIALAEGAHEGLAGPLRRAPALTGAKT